MALRVPTGGDSPMPGDWLITEAPTGLCWGQRLNPEVADMIRRTGNGSLGFGHYSDKLQLPYFFYKGVFSSFYELRFRAMMLDEDNLGEPIFPTYWTTREHWFHAHKMDELNIREAIASQPGPYEAKEIGNSRSMFTLRADWDGHWQLVPNTHITIGCYVCPNVLDVESDQQKTTTRLANVVVITQPNDPAQDQIERIVSKSSESLDDHAIKQAMRDVRDSTGRDFVKLPLERMVVAAPVVGSLTSNSWSYTMLTEMVRLTGDGSEGQPRLSLAGSNVRDILPISDSKFSAGTVIMPQHVLVDVRTMQRTLPYSYQVMVAAIIVQVGQYRQVREALAETGDRLIAEDSPHDARWGIRDTGNGFAGLNWLGAAWMEARDHYRDRKAAPCANEHCHRYVPISDIEELGDAICVMCLHGHERLV